MRIIVHFVLIVLCCAYLPLKDLAIRFSQTNLGEIIRKKYFVRGPKTALFVPPNSVVGAKQESQ